MMEVAQIIESARQFGANWASRFRFRERRDPGQDRWIFTAQDGTEHLVFARDMPAIAEQLGGWPADHDAQPVYLGEAA